MVQTDERLGNAFPKPPMACLRRGPNLQDELVRGRLPRKPIRASNREVRVGFSSCKAGRRVCSLCQFTCPAADKKTVVSQVKIEHSGLIIPLQQKISCRDSNCLYILSCIKPGCMRQYAGQYLGPCTLGLLNTWPVSGTLILHVQLVYTGRKLDIIWNTWYSYQLRKSEKGVKLHSDREKNS